jgi:hypothetical protein
MSQHVSEHGESHRRCRNVRNGNHQLLYGQVQISLTRRPKAHTIIKTYGDGSEDTLQHTYDLVVSFQKTRTRWCIKATGLNETRDGWMFSPSRPRENANAPARRQRQRTSWGNGIKPKMDTKSTWYMFKDVLSKTTEILIKKKQRFLLPILIKEKY